jgi:hypothetical protein
MRVLAARQRRFVARASQAVERTRGRAAAIRRAGSAERSASGGLLMRSVLRSVLRRNTPAVLVFYFGLSVIVLVRVLRRRLRRVCRLSLRVMVVPFPAPRIVLNRLRLLRERATMEGARIPMALAARAHQHAATTRHQAIGTQDGISRQRARQDAEQQRRRQD